MQHFIILSFDSQYNPWTDIVAVGYEANSLACSATLFRRWLPAAIKVEGCLLLKIMALVQLVCQEGIGAYRNGARKHENQEEWEHRL